MWENVYEGFNDLTKSQQMSLFEAIKQDLFPEETNN